MKLRKYVLCSAVLLFAHGMIPGVVRAAIVFEEYFEGATAGSNITTSNTGFNAEVQTGGANSSLHAIADDGSIFADSNQYLRWLKGTSSGQVRARGDGFSISSSAFHLSFDFYDIQDDPASGANPTEFRLGLVNNESTASADRAIDISLLNGNLGSIPGGSSVTHTTYTQGVVNHLDVVGSLVSGDPVEYVGPDGNPYTVGYQKLDFWLNDGVTATKVATGVAFRTSQTEIDGIYLYNAQNDVNRRQTIYLDNIVLRNDIDFSPIPEPSAIFLTGFGIIGLGMIRLRQRK